MRDGRNFSEGIDLTDDKLIGAVIAGTGLPQVCTEREILKQYFNAADMDGFDYAYLYPGMNKVLQSAGRVIRTESDRGVILLLDDRFREMRYREVFPREWQQYQLGSVKIWNKKYGLSGKVRNCTSVKKLKNSFAAFEVSTCSL